MSASPESSSGPEFQAAADGQGVEGTDQREHQPSDQGEAHGCNGHADF